MTDDDFVVVSEDCEAARWFDAESTRWRERWATVPGYKYGDHAVNAFHGFRFLPNRRFDRALGFGAADGQELEPILDRIGEVTVIDPCGLPLVPAVQVVHGSARLPNADGRIDDPDGRYDLITCFGALCFTANPPSVLAELVRCLSPRGWMILREPITALNLEQPEEAALGNHGRGIPLRRFDKLIAETGLDLRHRSLCNFPATTRIFGRLYDRPLTARVDAITSRAFEWNTHYFATRPWHHLRPKQVVYVLTAR